MTSKVPPEILPIAPLEYDAQYLNRLARQLQNVIIAANNPLTNIPSIRGQQEISALQLGDVYKDENGFVKIVTEDDLNG